MPFNTPIISPRPTNPRLKREKRPNQPPLKVAKLPKLHTINIQPNRERDAKNSIIAFLILISVFAACAMSLEIILMEVASFLLVFTLSSNSLTSDPNVDSPPGPITSIVIQLVL